MRSEIIKLEQRKLDARRAAGEIPESKKMMKAKHDCCSNHDENHSAAAAAAAASHSSNDIEESKVPNYFAEMERKALAQKAVKFHC